jgi:hypothetical protein
MYMNKVDLDGGSDTSLSLLVTPLDSSGYPTKNIYGKLKDSSGEFWQAGEEYKTNVATLTGGEDGYRAPVGTDGDYSIDTRAFSEDCMVWFYNPFQTMVKMDLGDSSPSPIELNGSNPNLANIPKLAFQVMREAPLA